MVDGIYPEISDKDIEDLIDRRFGKEYQREGGVMVKEIYECERCAELRKELAEVKKKCENIDWAYQTLSKEKELQNEELKTIKAELHFMQKQYAKITDERESLKQLVREYVKFGTRDKLIKIKQAIKQDSI